MTPPHRFLLPCVVTRCSASDRSQAESARPSLAAINPSSRAEIEHTHAGTSWHSSPAAQERRAPRRKCGPARLAGAFDQLPDVRASLAPVEATAAMIRCIAIVRVDCCTTRRATVDERTAREETFRQTYHRRLPPRFQRQQQTQLEFDGGVCAGRMNTRFSQHQVTERK